MKYKGQITRKMLVGGFEFAHLGTRYRVIQFYAGTDVVRVENPDTGFIGTYSFSLIKKHGKIKKQ